MDEKWLPVVGYEGLYEISDLGRVRTLGRSGTYKGRWGTMKMTFPAKVMTASTTPAGYKYVALKRPNEKTVKCLVHRLVLRAFAGEFPADQPQVNHKDGDKANNRLENLEFVSCLENLRHCIDTLGKKRGEGSGTAKVTEAQVRAIRVDTRILREVAEDYGITLQAVWLIRKGRNWAHLSA